MKKANDLTILLLVLGVFVAFIGSVYYVRDSADVLNERSKLGMGSSEVRQNNPKGTDGESSSVGKDKPQKALPAKSVLGIDLLSLTGLMFGLPLIFQGRVKLVYICLAVGVFVTIIDLILRVNFKVV